MTLAVLRALHAIIGDALEDIDAVYSTAASSRSSSCTLPKEPEADVLPPSPASSTQPKSSARRAGTPPLLSNHSPTPATTLSVSAPSKRIIDFPSLDDPVDPADDADAEAERLRSNPAVANAVSRIVAACGQLSITVRSPFLVLCDAGMGYHLPSALRFLEAAHIPELLRPAGPEGLHVSAISAALGVDAEVEGRIAHILRLLATHHLLIEREPNVFALNRISAMLDTGKTYADVARAPEKKYESTNGVAAFFALNTDELFKASAYLTESILPHTAPPEELTVPSTNPSPAPPLSPRTGSHFWAWLEAPGNEARLARFGSAMGGSRGWEEDGIEAFPFASLPDGALVVDVGGGIGSTSMLLAERFKGLRFVIQDREAVCKLGRDAWRARCPELLEEGRAVFQVHDFFTPQPARHTPVGAFILRVILHDWPDAFARRILVQLRRAAAPDTFLVIGDHVLPYACAIEGAEALRTLRGAKWPLLANLGQASANAYWMDLTMQVTFNGLERTLPELVALTASAGWRIVRVARTEGSLF
ncbi:S-adenosyl-L-methionine-dependent methyltransferase, partial [Dentipellis sp. KUC8613]